jgi:hypothetical protein
MNQREEIIEENIPQKNLEKILRKTISEGYQKQKKQGKTTLFYSERKKTFQKEYLKEKKESDEIDSWDLVFLDRQYIGTIGFNPEEKNQEDKTYKTQKSLMNKIIEKIGETSITEFKKICGEGHFRDNEIYYCITPREGESLLDISRSYYHPKEEETLQLLEEE